MPAVDAYSHGVPRSGRIGGRRLRSDPGTRLPLAPRVPFLRAPASAAGAVAVAEALRNGHLKARGPATARCERLLQDQLSAPTVLMTQSCTAALELSALLLGVVAGDEIIMPSFGFASAANAFVLRGATPVFVDVLPGTLNIDPAEVRAALTARTRAVVVVHYAGTAAPMDELLAIAATAGVAIIEDAAQGIGASYRGRALGSMGALGAISFDATKNLASGSGGALVINDPALASAAETLRDYGTDRARFARGEVEHYRWMQVGSNFAMNELAAAYLAPQLADLAGITQRRQASWNAYQDAFAEPERRGLLRRLTVPESCTPNAHIFGLLLPTAADRDRLLRELAEDGVEATFHYVPLHSAPAGLRYGRAHGTLPHTEASSARLLRLPLWNDMPRADAGHVITSVLRRLESAPVTA